MQAERNELVTKTFPALRAKYRARGLEVFEVDLRWGITRQQQERGETLPTLLGEIDRCQPYFIGLLGDRYGWAPPPTAITDKLRADFPAIANADGESVTAMEIKHGVLCKPDADECAIFFEREPGWDWSACLSEEDREAATNESDSTRAKLDELKSRIRQKARIEKYTRPDELGQKVYDALDALLEARFPDAVPDAFEQTARLHCAYARERRGLHVGAERYLTCLHAWAEEAKSKPLLITGAAGSGKSSLMANWVFEWGQAHPNSIVFEHYLAASTDSAEPIFILRRLWEHLNRATGDSVELPTSNAELMDVAAGLGQRVARAQHSLGEARIIVALDGLDRLSSEPNLRWLPPLPGVRILASALDGPAKTAALESRFERLEVEPLDAPGREALIHGTLGRWGRQLERRHVERLLRPASAALAGSPLYLKTVLDELRVSADHAQLANRLEVYSRVADLTELFERVLERLEDDCEPRVAAQTLPLIWASRAGLEEAEIVAIAGVSPLAWATLRNGLGDGIRDQAGRMVFGHNHINQAVEARYITSESVERATRIAIADRFEHAASDDRQAEELPYQLRKADALERLLGVLTDLDRFEALERRDPELRRHWSSLRASGADPQDLLCAAFKRRIGERGVWMQQDLILCDKVLGFLVNEPMPSHSTRQLAEEHSRQCEISSVSIEATLRGLHVLHAIIVRQGDVKSALELAYRMQGLCTEHFGRTHSETLNASEALARDAALNRDMERAVKLQEDVVRICESKQMAESEELSAKCTLAEYKLIMGDRSEAFLAWAEDLLASCLRLLGPSAQSTITLMANVGGALGQVGKWERALRLQEDAATACVATFGTLHPGSLTAISNFAITLEQAGQSDDALRLQEIVLAGRSKVLGEKAPPTLATKQRVMQLLLGRGDLAGLQRLFTNGFESGPDVSETAPDPTV